MDTILYHGVVRTMAGRTASAVAIRNGRIALVGSDEAALALRTAETQVIDLGGRCVLPGFTDSHMHLLHTALSFRRMDLRGVTSIEELIARGRAYVAAHPPADGEWIMGYGFDHNLFDPPVLPDGRVAEAICAHHPVVLDRVCGHVGTGNPMALALAGFDESTVIPGGELERDASGKLNGVVKEAALDRLKQAAPRFSQRQVESLLEEVGVHLAAAGLTCVHSDDLGPEGADWPVLEGAFAALAARNACPVRLYEEWEAPHPAQLRPILDAGFVSGQGTQWLRLGNIKLLMDGSLGARTAFLREDYSDCPGSRGIPVYTQEELDEMVSLCHRQGLQVACHCIGDGACQRFVNAVERAMAEEPKPLRHRVVHCQIGDRALYRRMAALGMGADVQPAFVPSDGALADCRLGSRVKESYGWKSLLDSGVLVCGGSDAPVEPFAPLWGIHCAVNRPVDGRVWGPEERLTTEQAVAMYTVTPARLAGLERDMGTIEAGRLADLTVLDRDIFTVPPEELQTLQVEAAMVNGRFTYRREL